MKELEIIFVVGFLVINIIIVIFGISMSINWRKREKGMINNLMKPPTTPFNNFTNKPEL